MYMYKATLSIHKVEWHATRLCEAQKFPPCTQIHLHHKVFDVVCHKNPHHNTSLCTQHTTYIVHCTCVCPTELVVMGARVITFLCFFFADEQPLLDDVKALLLFNYWLVGLSL